MDNLVSYVKFRQDVSFKASQFNELDAMVMAALVGLDFEGVIEKRSTIQEVAFAYRDHGKRDVRDEELEAKEAVLYMAAGSKRYGRVMLENYVKEIDAGQEMTFYALTFSISPFEAFVAYRGTDGSLLSWKENFVGLYMMPTPGQYRAVKYLSHAAARPFRRINVVGHSKGGNLAVFAAMTLEERLQKRIGNIYVFDAPGFNEDVSNKLGYLRIKDRIKAFVPKCCVIGNLMKPTYERTIVDASGRGMHQHDMFTWSASATGLVATDSADKTGKDISLRANKWIDSISMDERKRVVDELFSVFMDNGILHISDMMHMDIRRIFNIIKCLPSLSSENRELLGIVFRELMKH